VHWRSIEPAGSSAELWAAVPQVAAPAAVEPPPPPLPKPLPKVEVKPVEPPPPPKADTSDADIALEKAKAAEKEKRDEQEREKQERLKAEKLEREKTEKAERAEKAKAAAEAERVAKLREENLKRMLGQAGATGAPQSTGTAQRDAGPSASYAARIAALIKEKLRDFQEVPVGTRAEVEVRAAADGTIVGRRLTKSSGNSFWDQEVLRAIDRVETLPKDENGRVPATIPIGFTR
jgi:colicin import membrane protein